MPHQRKLIRDHAVSMLMGQTAAGSKVFANRVRPLISNGWLDRLPAIVIYTLDESSEIFNAAPHEYMRTVQLMVEIQARAEENLDDVLDAIADDVERILLRDDTLGGTVNDLRYAQTRMALREDGENLIGACLIQFDAEYLDVRPDGSDEVPGFNATLPDLNTVTTQYSLNNQQDDPDDRAETRIEGLNP